MSTRAAIIFKDYRYSKASGSREVCRMYHHCDGYPEYLGCLLAEAAQDYISWQNRRIDEMNELDSRMKRKFYTEPNTVFQLVGKLGETDQSFELEPQTAQHGDLDYLYIVECLHGAIGICIYRFYDEQTYEDLLNKTPEFCGLPQQLLDKYGKEFAHYDHMELFK